MTWLAHVAASCSTATGRHAWVEREYLARVAVDHTYIRMTIRTVQHDLFEVLANDAEAFGFEGLVDDDHEELDNIAQ